MRRGLVRQMVLVAVAVASLGCGVPLDDSPRAMQSTRSGEPSPTSVAQGDTAAYIYLLLDGSLVPAAREVPSRQPGPILDSVVQAPTADETTAGFISQVPMGTEVLGSVQSGDVLSVDLSTEFENVIGRTRQEAIGQMVFSATDLPGINEVTFSIDGTPLQVSSPTRGDVERVMDCDFLPLLPTDDKIVAAGIGTDAARRVISRRRGLEERCPQVEAGS